MHLFQKHIITTFLIAIAIFTLSFSAAHETAKAQSGIVDQLRSTVGDMLPNYYDENAHHDVTAIDPGPISLGSAMMYLADFVKYIVGSIAVVYLFISAYKLITAGDEVEDVITKQKQSFQYILIGFAVIILSTTLVKDVLSPTGEIDFIESRSFAEAAAIEASAHVRGLYRFIEVFIGAIAILYLIIAAFQMMIGGGDEATLESQKKHIIWALVGLIVIGISEFVVQKIIFEDYGSKINFEGAEFMIGRIVSFFVAIVAILSIVAVIYAGLLFITSLGVDDSIQKAKRIVWGVILALVITAGVYAIVSTFITLQPS